MPTGFLTLPDLILPPPLPALISILLLTGAAGISEFVTHRLQRQPTIPQRAAVFVLLLAVCGATIHALALAHLATLTALRLIAAPIIAAGCATILNRSRTVVPLLRDARRFWAEASFTERAAALAIASSTIALLLAACGPVTDPDSLDYHLGVPLDWLRHNGVVSQPHWLHARLVGLGEALNMLGLTAGTDCFGAMLQVGGLLVVMAVIGAAGKTTKDRLFGLLLALPPAILPLATAQKPQLLPAAGLVVAMMLARTAASSFDFVLVFGCVAFAIACKYSFLVSGGVVLLIGLSWAYKRGKPVTAALCAIVAFAIFVVPVMGRDLFLYGDPVSPFLERFRHHPDPEVTQFAVYLQNVGGPHTPADILQFLRALVLPSEVGDVQTIIGIGIFALLLVPGTGWSAALLSGFTVVLLFTVWRGQMAPRYLLEPWLWCAAAAAAAPWSRLKSLLFHGLTLQTFGVAAMAIFVAALLLPGALTPALRDRVMRRSTFGYLEAQWLDRVVPAGETVLADSRAYAVMPRPFVIPACAACGGASVLDLANRNDFAQAAVVIPEFPVEGKLPDGCVSRVVAGPERFPYSTRSPFNKREYQAIAWRVAC